MDIGFLLDTCDDLQKLYVADGRNKAMDVLTTDPSPLMWNQ